MFNLPKLTPAIIITLCMALSIAGIVGEIARCGLYADPYISTCKSSVGRLTFPNSLFYLTPEWVHKGSAKYLFIALVNLLFIGLVWRFSGLRKSTSVLYLFITAIIYLAGSLMISYGIFYFILVN